MQKAKWFVIWKTVWKLYREFNWSPTIYYTFKAVTKKH